MVSICSKPMISAKIYNKRKLQLSKNMLWVRAVTSGQLWSEQQTHTDQSPTAWLSFGQEINTTFKPDKPDKNKTSFSCSSLLQALVSDQWETLQLGKPLVHCCPSPLGVTFPAEGLEAPQPPWHAKHTNAFPLPALDENSSLWHPVSGSLPAQPPPTCLTQPIKAGIYSRQLGASTISHSRQEALVRGVTGWKWWCLSPRCPHTGECREPWLVWLLWKMQNKLL